MNLPMKAPLKHKSAAHLPAPVKVAVPMPAIGAAMLVGLAPIAAVTMPLMWAAGE